jgi:hypothetical protein
VSPQENNATVAKQRCKMNDDILTGTIDEISDQAEKILAAIVPGAWCQAQEWDNRIDCGVKQPDGSVATEMIALEEATVTRIKASGERLLQRQRGIHVPLQNELPRPILIRPEDEPSDEV